ncbi:MAG: hypothetical protein JSU73_06830 [candidate division WOR-3 bacterium]|nr:MAG: hypothetical protein JSU73_06830 [candidate division WOR-3 bacterium]
MKSAMSAVLLMTVLVAGAQACCGHCGWGSGSMEHSPAAVQKSVTGTPSTPPDRATTVQALDEQIKFVKETAQLRTDLVVSQLEMRKLWLASQPDADKLSAKMLEILRIQKKLAELGPAMTGAGWSCWSGLGAGTGMTGCMHGHGMIGGCGGCW